MDVLISEQQIAQAVRHMAHTLRDEYRGRPLTVLGVLTGSLIFLADLIREMDLPLQVGLIQASSYRDQTSPGELLLNDAFLPPLADRHVLIVDDIFDTGQTLQALTARLSRAPLAGIRSVVLLWKEGRQTVDFAPDYYCFRIPNRFVVGYGLDFNNDYRYLRYIAALDQA